MNFFDCLQYLKKQNQIKWMISQNRKKGDANKWRGVKKPVEFEWKGETSSILTVDNNKLKAYKIKFKIQNNNLRNIILSQEV